MGLRVGALKLVIIVPNVLTLFMGVAMIVSGAFAFAHVYQYKDEKHHDEYEKAHGMLRDGAAVALAAGILTSIVSMIALCGVVANSRPLLILYSVIMSLILILEVVSAILGFIFYNNIKSHFQEFLRNDLNSWSNQDEGENADWNFLITVQGRLECCGVESGTDWLNAKEWKSNNKTVPSSCCGANNKNPCFLPNTKSLADKEGSQIVSKNEEGCYYKLLYGAHIVGEISIAVFFIQLIILLLAIYFSKKIKEDQSVLIF